MISDVLLDAIAKIQRYQEERPAAYDSMRAEIDAVVTAMESLRAKLDTPPSADAQAWLDELPQESLAAFEIQMGRPPESLADYEAWLRTTTN